MTVSLGTDRARFSLVLLEKTTTKQNGEKVEMKGTGNGRALKIVLVAAVFSCTGTAGAGQNLAELQKWSDGFAEVVAQVKPGVVAISTESKSRGEVPNYRGTPFEFFFRGPPREMPRQGQGSGVIVSHEGEYFILTNYHVIRGADEITVELTDERHFPCRGDRHRFPQRPRRPAHRRQQTFPRYPGVVPPISRSGSGCWRSATRSPSSTP